MFKKALFFLTLLLTFVGATSDENNGGSGRGWLDVVPFERSVHQALIRGLIEADDYDRKHIVSDADFERLEIAVRDLNDDGMAEVIIYFGVTAYCGTVGCDMGIYQKINGSWRRIGFGTGYVVWVSDQKVLGYRTLYSQGPDIWRWDGNQYGGRCELPPPDEQLPPEVRGFVGKNCESDEG